MWLSILRREKANLRLAFRASNNGKGLHSPELLLPTHSYLRHPQLSMHTALYYNHHNLQLPPLFLYNLESLPSCRVNTFPWRFLRKFLGGSCLYKPPNNRQTKLLSWSRDSWHQSMRLLLLFHYMWH